MAKKKTNTTKPILNILPQIPSKESKNIKVGGRIFEFEKEVIFPGFPRNPITIGATLVECNDGWFKLQEVDRSVNVRLSYIFIGQNMKSIKQIA